MKSKSYGLTDLATLHKNLRKESAKRLAQEKEEKKRLALSQSQANEFLQAVKNVHPIKQTNRYQHPAPSLKLPDVRIKLTQETNEPEQQGKTLKKLDTLSDEFDTQHLRDDDQGIYLRKDIPPGLIKKLQRGDWPINDRLDLHGKTTEEARVAISAFLYQSMQKQHRVISIIHGQGFSSQHGLAVLKQHVRNWLAQTPNVLAFCYAPMQTGGHGAVLVLLDQVKKQT